MGKDEWPISKHTLKDVATVADLKARYTDYEMYLKDKEKRGIFKYFEMKLWYLDLPELEAMAQGTEYDACPKLKTIVNKVYKEKYDMANVQTNLDLVVRSSRRLATVRARILRRRRRRLKEQIDEINRESYL